MSFFRSSENGEKSHRFVCRFFCRPKTGRKVIGLYVVFYVGRRKTGKKVIGLYGFRVRVRIVGLGLGFSVRVRV